MAEATGPLNISLEESVPFVTILTITGVTSIAANLLIVGITCKNSQRRKVHDLFTLHSSLVDLLTASVVVPFWILSTIHSRTNFVGDIYCKVSATLGLVELLAPAMFLMLVATSRHCSVIDKMAFPRIFSDFRSNLMAVIVWLFSFLISIPPHVAWSASPEIHCLPDLVTNSWYTTSVLSFCFLLPLSAAFYTHIYDIFIFQPERMKRDDSTRRRCEIYGLRGSERTTQKVFFVILIIHTCCWAPYLCVALTQAMNGGKMYYTGKFPIHFVALVVALTGTALKGVVSCFELPDLKESIKKQFGCVEQEESEGNTTRIFEV